MKKAGLGMIVLLLVYMIFLKNNVQAHQKFVERLETVSEFEKWIGTGRTLTLNETQKLQHCLIGGDAGFQVELRYGDTTIPLCERARHLVEYRLAVRLYTRSRGSLLDQRAAEADCLWRYGNTDGASYKWLMEKHHNHCEILIGSFRHSSLYYEPWGSDEDILHCHLDRFS